MAAAAMMREDAAIDRRERNLEGRVIYTVVSGKRGAAYLTRWRTLVPLNKGSPGAAGAGPPGAGDPPMGAGAPTTGVPPMNTAAPVTQQQTQKLEIKQQYRIQCSPVPVSATSLSSDSTLFMLGTIEGSILLYNLETKKVMKQFNEVHDLPVTCMASRPVPNMLMLLLE